MGGVLNRYLKYEGAGDQYVGRCVTGRNRMNTRFAESMPYFDFSGFGKVEKETMMRTLDDWIKRQMPAGGAENESVFCLFRCCLASLIYHKDWLEENLHSQNPLFLSPFLCEDIPFANHVRTAFPWNTTTDTPAFTGLPSDVFYMEKIEQLKIQLAALQTRLEAKMDAGNDRVIECVRNELDDRGIGGGEYEMSKKVEAKLDILIENHKRMEERYLPAPFIRDVEEEDNDDHNQELTFRFGEDEDYLEEVVVEAGVLDEQALDIAIKKRRKEILSQRRRVGMTVGFHNGVLNPLLPDWKYPNKMNLREMISLWLMGAPNDDVPPLRVLIASQVNHFDSGGRNLNRMKNVMDIVEHVGRLRGVWRPDRQPNYWNGMTVNKLWDGIEADIRPHCATVTTVGDSISTHKTRERSWRTDSDKLIPLKNTLFLKDDYK